MEEGSRRQIPAYAEFWAAISGRMHPLGRVTGCLRAWLHRRSCSNYIAGSSRLEFPSSTEWVIPTQIRVEYGCEEDGIH